MKRTLPLIAFMLFAAFTFNVKAQAIVTTSVTGTVNACAGMASSGNNIARFSVSGSSLSAGITINANASLQISLSATGGYGGSLTLARSGSVVNSTTVYVRSSASAATGSLLANVQLLSSGATTKNVTITGVINALPTVNPVASQVLVSQQITQQVVFSGTGDIYNWVNDNPAIGIGASGTGNIPRSGTGISGTVPITGNFIVTPAKADLAYVVYGSMNNVVNVVNTGTNSIAATIPVGSDAYALSVSPDGNKVYVANSGSGSVSVINSQTNTVTATVTVGSSPFGIAAGADGSRVYVSNYASSTVSVINALTNTVVATIGVGADPRGIAVSPDGTKVYVANTHDGTVSVINAATNAVTNIVTVGTSPLGITFKPDGSRAYVVNSGANTVSVVNTVTGAVVTTIPVGTSPQGAAISPNGSVLYVSNYGSNTVSAIATATNNVTGTISTGTNPNGITASSDGLHVYVTNTGSANISVINTSNYKDVQTITSGGATPQCSGNFIKNSPGCTGVPARFSITVKPSVTKLTSFAISTGTLSPAFDPLTSGYTTFVDASVISIKFTPAVADTSIVIKVANVVVPSGKASAAIPLNMGANNIYVELTAKDGTNRTYGVKVNRASINLNLAAMRLGQGVLSPAFTPAFNSYSTTVNNLTTSIDIFASVADSRAILKINGSVVKSGASGRVSLGTGTTAVPVTVSDTSGANQVYTVYVTKAATDARLRSLLISNGTLSPGFSYYDTVYTAAVSGTTSSIKIVPASDDSAATIKVNGVRVISGTASASLPLAQGINSIIIAVTSQNGTSLNYKLSVTRASSDADLKALTLSNGILSPAFLSTTIKYTASVSNSISAINIYPTAADGAHITANNIDVKSGGESNSIALATGANTIAIKVTAVDGTVKTYTLVVTRGALPGATLAKMVISTGTLTPVFDAGTLAYTAAVANGNTAVRITPVAGASSYTITVNGTAVKSGTVSAALPLAVGTNVIKTVVTTTSGSSRTYTVTVTRAGSADANLAKLVISPGTLTPAFTTGRITYTAALPNANAAIRVTPVLGDATASVTINGTAVKSGTASAALPLMAGANLIKIVVAAQDGTVKTYTLTVTRAALSDANLAKLVISVGTLTPAFTAGRATYTATVSSGNTAIRFTPVVGDATATVAIDSAAVKSGASSAAIPLAMGANVIKTVVTAQDGTIKTYTVTVTRPAPALNAVSADYTASLFSAIDSAKMINDGIVVHNAISPNGDGIGDFLMIDGITNYPDNSLQIVNLVGKLVFEAKGYDNVSKVFNGRSNKTGAMQPSGTYFYALDYKAGGLLKRKTGYIVLR